MELGLIAVVLACVAVFAATSFMTFKVNERRFVRRNMAGIEEFTSYGNSLATRTLEWFVMFLARPTKWASIAIGLSAVFMLVR